MKTRSIVALILLSLFLNLEMSAEVKEYNKISNSVFKDKTPKEVFDKSYFIGKRDYWTEVRKYKDGNEEIYLLECGHPQPDKPRAFIVIPKRKLTEYLMLLNRMTDILSKAIDPNSGMYKDDSYYYFDEDPWKQYEIILVDPKSENSSLFGVFLKQTLLSTSLKEINNVYYGMEKVDEFTGYITSDGEFWDLDYEDPENIKELKAMLISSMTSDKRSANPDTFERLGTYTYRIQGKEYDKNEVLRFRKKDTAIYYIKVGYGSYINEKFHSDYLWIDEDNCNKLRILLKDAYKELSKLESLPLSKLKKRFKDGRIPLSTPDDLKFGGKISAIFDTEMNVAEGKSMADEKVRSYIFFDDDKNVNYCTLVIHIGDSGLYFDDSQDLKELIDSLDK